MTATADSLVTDERFEVHNPADGRVIATVPVHAAEQVAVMAAGLRAAQPEWEAIGPRGRARHLLDWLDWIMDNERRLLDLDQAESGKSWGDVAMETSIAVEMINYITKNLDEWLADQKISTYGPANVAKRLRVHLRPHQLVGIITPWNAPLGMPMLDVPFALAAGAAVLTKPSEATPLTWAEVVRGWREEIGAPPVLGCATGRGATGAAVVDEVDMIQFTGSTRTGRAIAIRAAERLIPCGLELGGKDAMIVLDDAPVDRAVAAAVWGGFYNCGQACISIERVYVHEKVYDEFVTKLAEQTAALRVGVDTDHSFTKDVGALVTPAQVDIVEHHVNDAVAKGARVLTGGQRRPPGNYFLPTVLVDVDHSMDCMTEETFGPTLPVMKVASEDEAITLANDSPYGPLRKCVDLRPRPSGARRQTTRDRWGVGQRGVGDAVSVTAAIWWLEGIGLGGAARRGALGAEVLQDTSIRRRSRHRWEQGTALVSVHAGEGSHLQWRHPPSGHARLAETSGPSTSMRRIRPYVGQLTPSNLVFA